MTLSSFVATVLEQNGVRRQWVNLLGHQTHCLEAGDGAAHIFWFPAVGDSASSFGQTLLLLAESLHGIAKITAVDPPGYGASLLPPDREMLSFTELEPWVQELVASVEEPLILVGNSSGGVLATAAALSKETQVAGLIFVGWPDWRFGTPPKADLCPVDISSLSNLLSRCWHRPPRLTNVALKNLLQQFTNHAYRGHVESFNANEFALKLDQFQGRLAFVGGVSDRLVPPTILEASAASRNNTKLCWITEAGHYPHREQPKQLVKVLTELTDWYLTSFPSL
ncbi:MAG: alpha/beta hydrolase [Symploca sp. SIO1B1]|nr:alpha/beta hydrolase [Symploca sp. SIO2D2]NER96359.1 alpha/beta hydrolase [Symploca sp. SIO1B1]